MTPLPALTRVFPALLATGIVLNSTALPARAADRAPNESGVVQ